MEFFKALSSGPTSTSTFPIRDTYDGEEYRRHQGFLSKEVDPANVSFLINTDGVAMFKSSSKEIWPIYLAINELPPQMR